MPYTMVVPSGDRSTCFIHASEGSRDTRQDPLEASHNLIADPIVDAAERFRVPSVEYPT